MKKKIKKAVLPVAGLGTRFLPATKVLPKEMMPLFNKPIIQCVVEEAMEAGIEEFIFVTGRGKVIIEDHFDISYELEERLFSSGKKYYQEVISKGIPQPGKAFFTRQQHPMGLGHAISCAKALVGNEPFAVLLPDEYLLSTPGCLSEMVNKYNTTNANMILAFQEVPWQDISSYGVIHYKEKGYNNSFIEVESVVEKPSIEEAKSNFAIIGRYILDPSIFSYLETQPKGVGGEIQLTDSIDKCLKNMTTYGYMYQGKRFDCGNPFGLLKASLEIALSNKEYAQELKDIINKKVP